MFVTRRRQNRASENRFVWQKVSRYGENVSQVSRERRVRPNCFHDIRKGEFIAFGANGSKRLGQVSVPEGTFSAGERNADLTKASAFRGNHLKPGTVSLALSYDGSRTASPFDGNVYSEVIITTGPAPVPSLDGKNIIFGRVDRESLDVISKIASTPVFSPSSQVKAWNFVASRVGDEGAATSKLVWTKPTKAVAIFQSGILEV